MSHLCRWASRLLTIRMALSPLSAGEATVAVKQAPSVLNLQVDLLDGPVSCLACLEVSCGARHLPANLLGSQDQWSRIS